MYKGTSKRAPRLPRVARPQAIRKARQRRRPGAIVYGDQETYQNVKALTDERATDNFSLERDFKNLTESGDISQDGRTN